MKLIPLTPDYELTEFDCGDNDLNDFLLEDAKNFPPETYSQYIHP